MLEKVFGLQGKHALITGGSGLLGRRHAEAILIAGGDPILADIDPDGLSRASEVLAEEFGKPVRTVVLDVTKEESVVKSLNDLAKAGVDVDILVNNAARNPAVGAQGLAKSNRLEDLDLKAFQLDCDVGLTGAILCAKIFGTAMAKRNRGVILNVASDLGVIAPDQRLYQSEGKSEWEQDVKPVSYSVVKHGIIGLTKYLATYWAHRGVRCNALSPGGVYTQQPEAFVDKIKKLIPLGRMAKVNEYEGAVIFLCSDASSYMNGANLIVDGGRSVW